MFAKVCGMRRQAHLDAAARLGYALCGFIFYPPSPRAVTPEEAASLESHALLRTGVFVGQGTEEILAAVETARLDCVQLHGGQSRDCARTLASTLGAARVLRVLWPKRFDSLEALQRAVDEAAEDCGMLLLDAGQAIGGHGTCLDLNLLTRLTMPVPWLLAGGLGPGRLETLAKIAPEKLPAGLDFNSALESEPGEKSPALMARALEEARALGLPLTDEPPFPKRLAS